MRAHHSSPTTLNGSRPTVRCTLHIGDWVTGFAYKFEIFIPLSTESLVGLVMKSQRKTTTPTALTACPALKQKALFGRAPLLAPNMPLVTLAPSLPPLIAHVSNR